MLRKGLVITTVILLPIATVLFIMSVHELFKMKTVTVDPKLKEISGIEFDKYKRLWAINDSGDGPILYMLNKDGSIEREVTVTNAPARPYRYHPLIARLGQNEVQILYVWLFHRNILRHLFRVGL